MATKSKKTGLRKHFNRTGGGSPPPANLELNEFDELVIEICGNTEMDGDENIYEAGFGRLTKFTVSKNIGKMDASKNSPSREVLHEVIEVDDDDETENSNSACKRLFPSSANDLATTPQKKSKQNAAFASTSTPTKRQFNQQQANVENAIAVQRETNDLLKQIIGQNTQIIKRLDFIANRVHSNQKEEQPQQQ